MESLTPGTLLFIAVSAISFNPMSLTQLSAFTIERAKWVIQWRFVLFEALRDPYISA